MIHSMGRSLSIASVLASLAVMDRRQRQDDIDTALASEAFAVAHMSPALMFFPKPKPQTPRAKIKSARKAAKKNRRK